MKNNLTALFVLLSINIFNAQDFNNYKPLTCQGKIPDEFVTSSGAKYKSEAAKIKSSNYKKKEKKDRKSFAIESNFSLDQLLLSGRVLFNDPVSNYLNEVADVLVKADGNFKKPVRVYVLRSTAVNAFATDRGSVFVTLGLLAQLENEAQLALILSHELTHVAEKHSVNLFLESKEIERQSNQRHVLGGTTFDDKVFAKNRYSRDQEMQADKQGLDRFLKTNYSTATLNTVFDVLKYAYLPFDDVAFDRSFFESATYKFPDDYWVAEVRGIRPADEKLSDENSTHPNIGARRDGLSKVLSAKEAAGKTNYVISESRFMELQKVARFELPMLYLRQQENTDAIYAAYLLSKKTPSSYLDKCVVKALYLHSKYKNDDDYTVNLRADSIEGESQRLYKLLDKLTPKEANILALRTAWLTHQKSPDDAELTAIADDLFVEFSQYFSSLEDFSSAKTKPEEKPDEPKKAKGEGSKYDKIKEKKASPVAGDAAASYWQHGFDEFMADADFKKAFDAGQKKWKERQDKKAHRESPKGKAERKKADKRDRKNGLNLGIPKVVAVNPFYLKLDDRNKQAIQFLETESGHKHFRELLGGVAKKSNLDIQFLDANDLKPGEAERFNDIRSLNEWFSEQVNYNDLSLTPGLDQEKINSIAKKYGTDYFLWTGVISLREKKKGAALGIALSVFFWPALPFAIAHAVKPEYDMLQYAVLYDVRTGRSQSIKFDYLDHRDSDSLLKAHFYDAFSQIKRKD